MIEIEKKYKLSIDKKSNLVTFLTEKFGKPKEEFLIDFRFNINENQFGGKDFERIRISRDKFDNTDFVYTKKFNIDADTREEAEYDTTERNAGGFVKDKTGMVLAKTRNSWHDCALNDALVSISIDEIENDDFCYIEIEKIEEDISNTKILHEQFDNFISQDLKEFDITPEPNSMLSMSKEMHLKSIEDLMGLYL